MDSSRFVKISKYLSYHLRHHPDEIGLQLAPGGWVEVEKLLIAAQEHSFPITRSDLEEVVAKNDKKRFSFDATGRQIRANQGHSIKIDLELEPRKPPDVLYHGTGHRAVESILATGLVKMSRHHVHLSTAIAIAHKVGQRHGSPVIFAVDAAAMYRDDYTFYCSENDVWLVDHVPVKYLQKLEKF